MVIQLTEEMIQGAKYTEEMTGVPASITLAQIIEESSGSYDGGMSGLAYKANNLFGVKSFSTNDKKIYMLDGNGNSVAWKKYDSVYDSIVDHANILSLDRYSSLYSDASSVADYAQALQDGGYAGTSTTYASKLMSHINTYNLNQYNLNSSSSIVGNGTDIKYADSDIDLSIFGSILKYLAMLMLTIFAVIFIIKSIGIEL